jgi:hypothetical protein
VQTYGCAVLLAAAVTWCAGGAAAQHIEGALPHDFDEPIRLYTTALGPFTRPISSPNADARAYFNQGFQLMYAFARGEAGRSFREAQKARSGVRDLLLGRGVGMEPVSQRGAHSRARRARARGDSESAGGPAACERGREGADRRDGRPVPIRSFGPAAARSGVCRRNGRRGRQLPG